MLVRCIMRGRAAKNRYKLLSNKTVVISSIFRMPKKVREIDSSVIKTNVASLSLIFVAD